MTSRQNDFSQEFQPAAGESHDHEINTYKRTAGKIPEEMRLQILEEVASGKKNIEVARKYGVHHTTISIWKRKAKASNNPSPVIQQSPPPMEQQPSEFPAAETGRYLKEFKEEVIRQYRCGRKGVEVAKQYGIPEGTLYRWNKEAKNAGGEIPEAKSTRPPTNASPINEEHRSLILSLKKTHPNMGLAQIQNQLKRFHALKLSRQMIGRIFSEAGIPLQKQRSSESDSDPSKNRFEMSRPNELWAVDFKELWIHSEKAYALFILDDFSRFCVGFALTQKPTAKLAIDTLQGAIQRHGRPERILSDRGPQFHAWNGVSQFDHFLADFFIDHTVTKANHCFTNGKVEAFNQSIEKDLFDVEEFASLKECETGIEKYLKEYNFLRTHMGIDGLVPADRYFAMVEEAQRALEEGLKKSGPALGWLGTLLSDDVAARRQPSVLQLVVHNGKLELVVLGRRFTVG